MADLAEVLKNALSLNVKDRAALAERLLASLDGSDEEEAEDLWAQEAQRRLEEYRAGRAGVAGLLRSRKRLKDSSGDSRPVPRSGYPH